MSLKTKVLEDVRVFEEARKIKPKHNLTAKQMDELVENEP